MALITGCDVPESKERSFRYSRFASRASSSGWRVYSSRGLRKTDDRRPGEGSKHLLAQLQHGGRGLDGDRKDGRRHLLHDWDNRVCE
jgi:hypothetical protein